MSSLQALTLAREAINEHSAIQKDEELASLIDLLWQRPVRVIVEIGVQDGGTSWLWTQIATQLVISVDQVPWTALGVLPVPLARIIGDSHSEETKAQVKDELDGRPIDFLFIDGDHSYIGVRKDLAMYSDFVATGGHVALHDIVPHADQEQSAVDVFWREISQFGPSIAVRPRVHTEFILPEMRDTMRGRLPIESCGIGVIRRIT